MDDNQLQQAFDAIPELVWLATVDGGAEYLNRRWLEYTGLSQTQAAGWGWTVAIHPDDVDPLTAKWRAVLKAGVRCEVEVRFRRFDGEYRWFRCTAEPLRDESGAVARWCLTNIDITEHRQAKTALEAREFELSLIIDTIPGFVWTASTDGQLTYVNRRLFDYIGAPMETLRGQGWLDFVHPDDRSETVDRWMFSVATGAPLENQYRLRRADGVYRWFHVPGQLGRATDGRPALWYGLLVDIDDRKNIEGLLFEERLAERTRIARDLHDTLLQSFQGVLLKLSTVKYLIRSRPEEAEETLVRYVDQARAAITEGRNAIQGLRSSTLVTNELAESFRALGEELNTGQTGSPCPELHVYAEGSTRELAPVVREEVYRIGSEAVRNACRHAQGSRVELAIQYGDQHFRLRISDNGKGIDSKILADGRTGHHGLRGLRERAQLAGGKLTLLSNPESGTQIELTIPAYVAYVKSRPLRGPAASGKGA